MNGCLPLPSLSPKAPNPHPNEKEPLTRAQLRFYTAGGVVLVLGLGAAVWAYRVAVVDSASDAIIAAGKNTKQYEYQMETYGGKSNLLATEVTEGFLGLWHGRNLAYTLATLSVVLASLCFFYARYLTDLPPLDEAKND
jgi:hypothetical protein